MGLFIFPVANLEPAIASAAGCGWMAWPSKNEWAEFIHGKMSMMAARADETDDHVVCWVMREDHVRCVYVFNLMELEVFPLCLGWGSELVENG